MDNDPQERKTINIPSRLPEVESERMPDFSTVAVRVLRRSFLEAMREIQNERFEKPAEKEVQFRDIVILFLKSSWLLAILAGGGYWLGHLHASRLPDLYSSSALLVPTASASQVSTPTQTTPGDQPSSDLSLFGVLMKSRTVMLQVLKSPVLASPHDTVAVAYARTIGIDTANSLAMQDAANSLASSIYLSDEGSGIFRLSFTSTDSFVVPQMADIVLEATQKELVRVKTQRMSSALAVLQRRLREAETDYRQASSRLALFLSRNVEMGSGDLQVRQTQLEADIRMKEQIYVQARERADIARSELDQAYPPAMVFDPASRPATLIGPDRRNKALLAGFIGLILGVVAVLGWEFLLKKRPR